MLARLQAARPALRAIRQKKPARGIHVCARAPYRTGVALGGLTHPACAATFIPLLGVHELVVTFAPGHDARALGGAVTR